MRDSWLCYLAENAMEQLATGLNKAAQAMQTPEPEAELGAQGAPSEVIYLKLHEIKRILCQECLV